MKLDISVHSNAIEVEKKFIAEIEKSIGRSKDVRFFASHESNELGQIVFVDQMVTDLVQTLSKIDRKGRSVILIVPETASVPRAFTDGRVDDVLVYPFRAIEVISKLKNYEQAIMIREIGEVSESLGEVTRRMKEDLEVATRLQKRRLPQRFEQSRGLQVNYRYFAGFKSGGDHFDLAESKDGSRLSVFLSDSSSYGLSSAVLGALMRLTVKLSADEAKSSADTVRKIADELKGSLGEKDSLSLFYGILNRKSFTLNFVTLGDCYAFRSRSGQAFEKQPLSGQAIRQPSDLSSLVDQTLQLQPGDRLVLLSDGFVETAGGEPRLIELLERHRGHEATDTLNELAFRVKSKFTDRDDLPDQDCTAFIFDIDAKLLRLQS